MGMSVVINGERSDGNNLRRGFYASDGSTNEEYTGVLQHPLEPWDDGTAPLEVIFSNPGGTYTHLPPFVIEGYPWPMVNDIIQGAELPDSQADKVIMAAIAAGKSSLEQSVCIEDPLGEPALS